MNDRTKLFEKVDALFAPFDTTQSPGCSIAVIENGELIYTRGYGMANLEHNIPNQPWTRYYLASMSKQFTAFCIALLEEEGKLNLEDDIRKWLPEIPAYQAPITIQHLVHHTSGLRDYLSLSFMAGHPTDDLITEEQTLELLARQRELNFTPGDEYLYSNTGYVLLSMIVARVSGMSFRQYAEKMIFKPLKMKHTHVHDNHLQPVPQRATGYEQTANGFMISAPNFDMVGDGGIYSCVEDLYKWDQNFYHNILGQGRPELIERVLSTVQLNGGKENRYAFGLMVEQRNGLKEVLHGGAYGGYRTEMVRYPEKNFSVVVLGNHGSVRPTDLARQVAEIFLDGEFEKAGAPVEKPVRISMPENDLLARSGWYYSANTGMSVEIKAQDGGLLASVADEFNVPIHPVSHNTFTTEDGPIPMQLEFTENGLCVILGSGKPITFERLAVQSLTLQEMEPLCGIYVSEELDARCKIILQDEKLTFKIGSLSETLKPVNGGMYLLSSGALFVDGAAAPAEGFTLQSGRVRNIRFTRLGG